MQSTPGSYARIVTRYNWVGLYGSKGVWIGKHCELYAIFPAQIFLRVILKLTTSRDFAYDTFLKDLVDIDIVDTQQIDKIHNFSVAYPMLL